MAPLPPLRHETWLMAEHPALRHAVPWLPLAHVPTPVEPCTPIRDYLGRDGVWIKRDDLLSPLYGGNKVRRFEHLLASAREHGASHILTVGGLGSTQVIAASVHGTRLGFQVTSVLFDQPVTAFVRRALQTSVAAGGRLVHGGSYASTVRRFWTAYAENRQPYVIAPGAFGPVANLGYVDAMFELAGQVERKEMPRPDVIVVAAGSGATLAALALGAAMLRWSTLLVGVRITDLLACNRATVRLQLEGTARTLAALSPRFSRRALPPPHFALDHRAVGQGYGHPTDDAVAAALQLQTLTGAPSDSTYTGKALGALPRYQAMLQRAGIAP